jgi:cell division protein FtsW (lipid II flippase)
MALDRGPLSARGLHPADGRRRCFVVCRKPAVAERLGVETLFFVKRQAIFLIPALGIMLAGSLLSPRMVRRVALLVFASRWCF